MIGQAVRVLAKIATYPTSVNLRIDRSTFKSFSMGHVASPRLTEFFHT
jgi:hypothetical protein